MMKKLVLFLLVSLFILSGCYYSYQQVDEIKEKLNNQHNEEYFALEEEKDYYQYKCDELEYKIAKTYDSAVVIKFYLMGYEEVTEALAKEAIKNIYDILYPEEW